MLFKFPIEKWNIGSCCAIDTAFWYFSTWIEISTIVQPITFPRDVIKDPFVYIYIYLCEIRSWLFKVKYHRRSYYCFSLYHTGFGLFSLFFSSITNPSVTRSTSCTLFHHVYPSFSLFPFSFSRFRSGLPSTAPHYFMSSANNHRIANPCVRYFRPPKTYVDLCRTTS